MTHHTTVEKGVMTFLVYVFSPLFISFTKPLGLLFDLLTIHYPNLFKTKNTPAKHVKKVESVQKQVIVP
jgi:hypothetical protein